MRHPLELAQPLLMCVAPALTLFASALSTVKLRYAPSISHSSFVMPSGLCAMHCAAQVSAIQVWRQVFPSSHHPHRVLRCPTTQPTKRQPLLPSTSPFGCMPPSVQSVSSNPITTTHQDERLGHHRTPRHSSCVPFSQMCIKSYLFAASTSSAVSDRGGEGRSHCL